MALPVTRSRVEEAGAGLAGDGWHYTPRQLYYATCARAEAPPSDAAANGEIGLGVLLVLIGLILIGIKIAFVLLVSLGAALVLAGVVGRLRRPVLAGRLLALSFDEFQSRFGDIELPGLIDANAAVLAPAGTGASTATVVCDTRETASMVAMNLDKAQLRAATVMAAQDAAAGTPAGRTIVLHDASPRGCALVLDLRDSGVAVEDAGLRPSEVDGPTHQVLEGAPARLPRDLSALLRPDELEWLLAGRRVEVATLPPEVVMDRVIAAVRRPEAPSDDAQ
jgi:hypothetical protein